MALEAQHIANAAKAKALYTDKQQPEDLLADWHFGMRSSRRDVANALRASLFLTDMLTDANVEVFWSHDLATFRSWLAKQMSPALK